MTELVDQDNGPVRAIDDVPKERLCLRCRTPFPSEGLGERICRRSNLRARQSAGYSCISALWPNPKSRALQGCSLCASSSIAYHVLVASRVS